MVQLFHIPPLVVTSMFFVDISPCSSTLSRQFGHAVFFRTRAFFCIFPHNCASLSSIPGTAGRGAFDALLCLIGGFAPCATPYSKLSCRRGAAERARAKGIPILGGLVHVNASFTPAWVGATILTLRVKLLG